MGLTEIGLLISLAGHGVTLYGRFRKTRTQAKKDDDEAQAQARAREAAVESEIEDRVIARWQEYAAEQEAARKRESESFRAEIRDLREKLDEAHAENAECRERAGRQEERIEHLAAEVKQLRSELKRSGGRPPLELQ